MGKHFYVPWCNGQDDDIKEGIIVELFNIIAGLASIAGLIIAIFAVNCYVNKTKKTKISQTAIGSQNRQHINFKGE